MSRGLLESKGGGRPMLIASARRCRRALAPALLALYVLPAGVAAAPAVAHAVDHIRDEIEQARRMAVAAGLVHGSRDVVEALATTRHSSPPTSPTGFVHTHDGSTHEHGVGIASLTRAAAESDRTSAVPPVAPSTAPHVGASVTLSSTSPDRVARQPRVGQNPLAVARTGPTPPPPRR